MRERTALRAATAFVRSQYPELAKRDPYVEVSLEQDGARRRSWSFGVHVEVEEGRENYVGYVHADGHVEGLY